jgi:hypothetical protein
MLETVVLGIPNTIFSTPPISTFSLSRLTYLELTSFQVGNCWSISMPSLRILRLVCVYGGADLILQSLLDQGPVVLTELSLHSSNITTSKLISLLEATSSLETLELTHVDDHANAVVEALANCSPPRDSTINTTVDKPTPHMTVICPSLKHITLSGCSDLTSGPIMRLIKSRLPRDVPDPQLNLESTTTDNTVPAIAQIETLVIDECPDIEPEILPWLRSKVGSVSCVYVTRKAAWWKRYRLNM